MKKLVFVILFIACKSLTASAQGCGDDFLGTKTLYKAPVQKYTPAPAGYAPVFINHVGRHGARHLTKAVEGYSAYRLLLKADSAGQLSTDGLKLKQMVLALQKVEEGGSKYISAEGRSELTGIGERMYANYSDVFKDKPVVNVRVTKESRTKQSADAFLQGLNKKLNPPLSPEENVDDVNLRFYDLSPAYKKFEDGVDEAEPKTSFDKVLHLDELNSSVTAKFFKPELLNHLDEGQKEKFVSDIFGFATIVYSLEAEIKKGGIDPAGIDFKSFFTCEQLKTLSMLDSADEYLKKGPGVNNDGIQVLVAIPLLVDFIKTTDAFIKAGKPDAELRFAHAETIAPFAALLQIEGADKANTDIAQISKVWQSAEVIPLSSNIQWIFYKKKGTGDYLVKVLLNEKEARITGLKSGSAYYKWTDLRAFYMNKLSRLHVGLADDMKAYLTSLK
jgi:multiple inositol-polyphosphate phosphatase/2,3-bisphosphoglycerate 3-phosphatase